MDLPYQIARLRYAQSISDEEATLLFARLAQQVQTQEQVVEVSAVHDISIYLELTLDTVSVPSCTLP